MTTTLEILDRLIAFPTVSAGSNLPLIDYVQSFLSDRGFAVHRIEDETGLKAGLFASIGPEGPGVLLSGHSDVVPVGGQSWTRDPFSLTQDGDRLYGRGTTDMKGYVASMLALAGRASSVSLSEPLKLALSYDEEIGCVGIAHMIGQLEETIGLPRLCLVGEPTEMRVATGHKGKAALRAVCYGQSGHSALAPRFVNALHLASDFVAGLRDLQAEIAQHGNRDPAYDIPYSTMHGGKLQGGTALNIVPDRAVIDFEFRHLAMDPPEDLLARVQDLAETVAAGYRSDFPEAAIEVEQINAYPGLDLDANSGAVLFAQSLAKTQGVTKVPFGTEAGYFSQLGIPSVVCGPGSMEEQGHKPDEYITVSQLAACDAMMDRLLETLTGRH